jgi:excisionase family DNA binding protein
VEDNTQIHNEGRPEILTVYGLAEIYDIPVSTIRGMAKRGEIPAIRFGKHLRFNLAEVRAVLEKRVS